MKTVGMGHISVMMNEQNHHPCPSKSDTFILSLGVIMSLSGWPRVRSYFENTLSQFCAQLPFRIVRLQAQTLHFREENTDCPFFSPSSRNSLFNQGPDTWMHKHSNLCPGSFFPPCYTLHLALTSDSWSIQFMTSSKWSSNIDMLPGTAPCKCTVLCPNGQ